MTLAEIRERIRAILARSDARYEENLRRLAASRMPEARPAKKRGLKLISDRKSIPDGSPREKARA